MLPVAEMSPPPESEAPRMKAPSGPLIKLLPFLRWWPMVTRKTYT